MTEVNDQQTTFEAHYQAQDSPPPQESPRSMVYILPHVVGAPKGFGEKRWQDILVLLNGIEVEAEILIGQSTTAGKGGRTRIAPSVMLVVNRDGADMLALIEVCQYLDSIFSSQMSARYSELYSPESGARSQVSWTRCTFTTIAEDTIRYAIELLRRVHRSDPMPINRAVWCRLDKTGAVERAVIDLTKAPGPVRFRTVTEKIRKPKRKRTRRGRIPMEMHRYVQSWAQHHR